MQNTTNKTPKKHTNVREEQQAKQSTLATAIEHCRPTRHHKQAKLLHLPSVWATACHQCARDGPSRPPRSSSPTSTVARRRGLGLGVELDTPPQTTDVGLEDRPETCARDGPSRPTRCSSPTSTVARRPNLWYFLSSIGASSGLVVPSFRVTVEHLLTIHYIEAQAACRARLAIANPCNVDTRNPLEITATYCMA